MVLLSHTAALIGSGLALMIQATLAQDTPAFNNCPKIPPTNKTPAQYTPGSIDTKVGQANKTLHGPPDTSVGRTNETLFGSNFPGQIPGNPGQRLSNGTDITNGTLTESVFPPLQNVTKFPPLSEPLIGIVKPSKDSWYRPTAGYEAIQPGNFMKSRPAPGNLKSILKNLKTADHILYRTSDTYLNPNYGLTTFLVPKVSDPKFPRLVSWQVPYETANFDYSPSYMLSTLSPEIRWNILDQMLGNGWHVSIPDYQGPKSAFGAGKMAGYSVLDSLRAIRDISYFRYGLDPWRIRHLAWGYSGGGLATAWAFKRKKWYLGVNFQALADNVANKWHAWVIGGLPIDLLHTLNAVDNKVPASFAINALSGMMQEFPVVKTVVERYAKVEGPHNISVFDRVRSLSPRQSREEYAYANLSDYFSGGFGELIGQLREKRLDEELRLDEMVPTGTPGPLDTIFVYHAVNDQMVPIPHVEKLLHRHWCRWFVDIEMLRNHEGGHEENIDNPNEVVLEWMARRFYVDGEIDRAPKIRFEQYPGIPLEGCMVHEAALKTPAWDHDSYVNGLTQGGKPDKEL